MNFGKREQIVALVVSGIVTVGAMHLLVFSPRASKLSGLMDKVKTQIGEVGAYKKVEPIGKVAELQKMNERLTTLYKDAVTSLGLSVDPIFNVPSFATTELSEEEMKGKDDGQIELARRAKLKAERDRIFAAQTDLLVKEVERLRAYAVKGEGGPAGRTEMSFLADRAGAWRMPTALPPAVQGSRIIDLLKDANDTQSILKNINPAQRPDLYAQQRAYYEGLMLELGLNKNLYRDPSVNGLLQFGEFVPVFHSVAIAELVEKQVQQQLGEDRAIGANTALDRKTIYDILEIRLPFGVMMDAAGTEQAVSEMYFLCEHAKFLNNLLALGVEVGIAEVFGARLEDAGYLVEAPVAFANPETTATPAPTPPSQSPYVLPTPWPAESTPMALGEVYPGALASDRSTADIGYSLPVILQYRTTNQIGMKFIFEVTRKFLMSEVESIRVLSQGTGAEADSIFFEVRFLGVPYIFALQETPVPTPPPAAPPPGAPAGAPAGAPGQPAPGTDLGEM